MTFEEAKAVRLDEDTDAGEFLYQNADTTVRFQRGEDNSRRTAILDAICQVDPTPESLAVLMTVGELDKTLSGLGQWGMSFESESDMDDDGKALAEKGVQSAEKFVRAARVLREWMDKHEGEK